MKTIKVFVLFILVSHLSFAQWSPAGNKIKTKWASEIDVNNVLPEYPRPIMEREEWQNLNGLWDYKIQKKGTNAPASYDGSILVPFPVESSLSGVMKEVGSANEVWYSREFSVPSSWKNKEILLHFGAVDWETEVWVNGIKVGTHTGGFTPFSFDISPFLKSGKQSLVVKVWDPTNDGPQPRGKQVKNPDGIWYTPVTGIWQTVWLEPVSAKHITDVRSTPDIDKGTIAFEVASDDYSYGDVVEITIMDGGKTIATTKAAAGEPITVAIPNAKLWSPESPFLYDTSVKLLSKGKTQDAVKGYFAMRKISKKRDENGIMRMQLNNKDYFQFGPLDQGWWPDGLYTAPTDEALKYDIVKTKEFGFNMIRKHVKVEPARWYTHCDRLGILVWQDMPNGDDSRDWQNQDYHKGPEFVRSEKSEAIYRKEWKEIMDYLHSYPSIVIWVPFNESWGQFKTVEITEWTQDYDPSRLVNSASGGNFFQTGDILDLHHYPHPRMFLFDATRVNVLGEYGGIGLPLEGHLWKTGNNWGYVKFNNSKEVTDEYVKYAKQLQDLVAQGFSGAIYTQTTDVEGEINGLMTYDRDIIKLEADRVSKANKAVIDELNK